MTGFDRKLAANSAVNVVAAFFTMGMSFIYIPKLYGVLGQELYGVWVLVFSLIGLLSFLQFGFDTSLVRHIAHARGLGSQELVGRYAVSGFFFYASVALIGCVGLEIFALSGGMMWLGISAHFYSAAVTVIQITGVVFALQTLNMWLAAVYRGLENYVLVGLVSIGSAVVTYPLGLVALQKGLGVPGLLVLQIVWLGMSALAGVVILGNHYGIIIGRRYLRRTEFREQLTFGGPFFFTTIYTTITSQADRLILSNILGAVAIPLYSIPQRLIGTIQSFTSSIFAILYPRIVSMMSSDNSILKSGTRVEHMTLVSMKLQLALTGLLVVPLIAVGRDFLTAWMGEKFADQATVVMWILGVFCFANAVRYMLGMRIGAERESMKMLAKLMFLYVLMFICLVYIGARFQGIIGVACAVASSEVILATISYRVGLRFLSRETMVQIRRLASVWLLSVMALSILSVALSEYLRLEAYGWAGVIIAGLFVALITYGVMVVIRFLPNVLAARQFSLAKSASKHAE